MSQRELANLQSSVNYRSSTDESGSERSGRRLARAAKKFQASTGSSNAGGPSLGPPGLSNPPPPLYSAARMDFTPQPIPNNTMAPLTNPVGLAPANGTPTQPLNSQATSVEAQTLPPHPAPISSNSSDSSDSSNSSSGTVVPAPSGLFAPQFGGIDPNNSTSGAVVSAPSGLFAPQWSFGGIDSNAVGGIQMEQQALSSLRPPERNLDDIPEPVKQVYNQMMPVLKRLFEKTLEGESELRPVSVDLEKTELASMNRRIEELAPGTLYQLDSDFWSSMIPVVRFLAELKSEGSQTSFEERSKSYKNLKEKAKAFAKARQLSRNEFFDALGGMEKSNLAAQMKQKQSNANPQQHPPSQSSAQASNLQQQQPAPPQQVPPQNLNPQQHQQQQPAPPQQMPPYNLNPQQHQQQQPAPAQQIPPYNANPQQQQQQPAPQQMQQMPPQNLNPQQHQQHQQPAPQQMPPQNLNPQQQQQHQHQQQQQPAPQQVPPQNLNPHQHQQQQQQQQRQPAPPQQMPPQNLNPQQHQQQQPAPPQQMPPHNANPQQHQQQQQQQPAPQQVPPQNLNPQQHQQQQQQQQPAPQQMPPHNANPQQHQQQPAPQQIPPQNLNPQQHQQHQQHQQPAPQQMPPQNLNPQQQQQPAPPQEMPPYNPNPQQQQQQAPPQQMPSGPPPPYTANPQAQQYQNAQPSPLGSDIPMQDAVRDEPYYPQHNFNIAPPREPLNAGGVQLSELPDDCIMDPDRTNPTVSIMKRLITVLRWGEAGHQLVLKSWGKNPAYPNAFVWEIGRGSEHPDALRKFFARGGLLDKVQSAEITRGMGFRGVVNILGVLHSKQDRLRRTYWEDGTPSGYEPPRRPAHTRIIAEWPQLPPHIYTFSSLTKVHGLDVNLGIQEYYQKSGQSIPIRPTAAPPVTEQYIRRIPRHHTYTNLPQQTPFMVPPQGYHPPTYSEAPPPYQPQAPQATFIPPFQPAQQWQPYIPALQQVQQPQHYIPPFPQSQPHSYTQQYQSYAPLNQQAQQPRYIDGQWYYPAPSSFSHSQQPSFPPPNTQPLPTQPPLYQHGTQPQASATTAQAQQPSFPPQTTQPPPYQHGTQPQAPTTGAPAQQPSFPPPTSQPPPYQHGTQPQAPTTGAPAQQPSFPPPTSQPPPYQHGTQPQASATTAQAQQPSFPPQTNQPPPYQHGTQPMASTTAPAQQPSFSQFTQASTTVPGSWTGYGGQRFG